MRFTQAGLVLGAGTVVSRGSLNSRYPWTALVRQSAADAGFIQVRAALAGEAFSLGGDFSPSVQVFMQRVATAEVAAAAYLGFYAEAFESDWRARLVRAGDSPHSEFPALSLNALNFKNLMPRPWSPFVPEASDVAAMRDWLDRLFQCARSLPSSPTGLQNAIEADKIGEHNIEAYLGHPVKVRGFVRWLRREHGIDISEFVAPVLMDRTEPYDVTIMLDPD